MTEPSTGLVLHKEKVDSWLPRRRVPEAGRKLVYTDPQGGVVKVEGTLTAGEQAYRRVAWVYEVDTSPKSLTYRTELPCSGDAFRFPASVTASWDVHDPRAVVENGDVDGAALVRGFLEAELPRISRRHEVTQAEATEEAIRDELGRRHRDLGLGVRLSGLIVRIDLDADARSAVAATVQEDWATEKAAATHRAALKDAEHAGELNLLQQSHERQLELARANLRREMETATARHQAVLEQENRELQLRLDKMRQDHNKQVLEGGLEGALAAHLTAHPEDTGTVLEVMAKRLDSENELIKSLALTGIDQDRVEDHQVAGMFEAAAERLRSRIAGPGLPAASAPAQTPSLPAAPPSDGSDGT